MAHFSLQLQPVMELVGHYMLGKEQIYSRRSTNSLKYLHQHVCISLTGSTSTVLHTEHGSSVMVLLIQGTEGLFYSLRKDNDNLCNTLCCNVRVCRDRIII